MIFQAIWPSIAKKPYIYIFLGGGGGGLGGGPDPLSLPQDPPMIIILMISLNFTCSIDVGKEGI